MITKTEASGNITDDCDAETDTHTNAASIEDNTNSVTDTLIKRKRKPGQPKPSLDEEDDVARAKKKTKKSVDVSPLIEECASPSLDDVGRQQRGKSPEEKAMLQIWPRWHFQPPIPS
jgi:hypothetical protein